MTQACVVPRPPHPGRCIVSARVIENWNTKGRTPSDHFGPQIDGYTREFGSNFISCLYSTSKGCIPYEWTTQRHIYHIGDVRKRRYEKNYQKKTKVLQALSSILPHSKS